MRSVLLLAVAFGVAPAASAQDQTPQRPQYLDLDGKPLVFERPVQSDDHEQSGLFITIHSPVHAVVTDTLRRRVGFDVASGKRYQEIPAAYYDDHGLGNLLTGELDANPEKIVELVRPLEGDYQVDITAVEDGAYSVTVRAYARDLTVLKAFVDETPIRKGESHAYRIAYSPEPGVQPKVSGGFPGGGQRPRDVDLFLSYSRPVTSRTTLPPGQTSYALAIHYGSTIDPDTLTVLLNGHDITREFQPARDGSETVAIELSPGRQVLKLTVDGLAGNRVATDTDRLVFLVP